VWLDSELLWFRELPALAFEGAPFPPVETGLEASRRRRLEARTARKRRLATRTVPAAALVLGSTTMLSVSALRQGGAANVPLREDPPSLTVRLDPVPAPIRGPVAPAPSQPVRPPEPAYEPIRWNEATSFGVPHAGRLVHGTRLPLEGPDWVTWSPVTDISPNRPERLYGHERVIRRVVSVLAAHRAAFPERASRVVVGDISLRNGGPMNEHVSHQNGLDVDVYYPRLDGAPAAPTSPAQVDRKLTQDLLDRFVAAGAQIIFVGYATGLHGPAGVVVPYPHHENHMHVRFPG
jgi:hypothetical protein